MAAIDPRPAAVRGLEIIAHFMKAVSTAWASDALYRGHASDSWSLEPSAFRDQANGIENRGQLRAWRRASQRFVTPPQSDLGYLVLAQHYSIPTGLLDWTSNPLIALFFAAQHLDGNHNGEVLQVERSHFHSIESMDSVEIFKDHRERPLLLDTSVMNVRSTAQDSYMTLHTRDEPSPQTTKIFSILAREKFCVRTSLAIFGLSPERVYVDLNMAAAQFKDELEFDMEIRDIFGEYAGTN